MADKLSALVMGSGYAAQGHTEALRYCGVDVVGMVSRSEDVVRQVAAELAIPYVSTNWEQALADTQASIVAIGTPGGAHFEAIMQAIAYKAHVFCDKPLAETAEKARRLYEAAQSAGVKTAYAASYRYQPNVLYARQLIHEGYIGHPLEIECISHFNLERLIPFGWSHRLEQGGGRLNNNFTHKLSIVEHLLDGNPLQVIGAVRNDMDKAPLVSGVHHFRTRREFIPSEDELASIEWGEVNAEWSYTVMAELESPHAPKP
ncbi:MAG: gfo/Idh/MocA family oxidoreductase, partial [Chloroflexi bacterium]